MNDWIICKQCERKVKRDEHWADVILTGGEGFWLCHCGELVKGNEQWNMKEMKSKSSKGSEQ
tara:strand:+ start:115 stop:300 length:186 start_codon:yes stop_codon:yes gene_type:complete